MGLLRAQHVDHRLRTGLAASATAYGEGTGISEKYKGYLERARAHRSFIMLSGRVRMFTYGGSAMVHTTRPLV